MDRKSANKIVQQKMKNMEVSKTKRKKISSATNSDSKSSIQQSPAIEKLQKKYLSLDDDYQPSSTGSDSSGTTKSNENDDVDVKIIVPKKKQADASGSSKDRTVILSKKKGFLGSQG